MNRWVVPVVALLVVAGLAFIGVGIAVEAGRIRDDGRQPAAAPGSQVAPEPGLRRFYRQDLAWQSCHSGDYCARLEVPVDYAHPGGETIRLAVLKVPATGDRIGSLVVNPGGPGASGIQYAAGAEQAFTEPVRAAYDIVGFDPRGVGESSPVDCLDDADLDRFVAEDPSPDSPAERRTFLEWTRRIGSGCVAKTGDLIDHVTTEEAARDMDVLRAALGEDRLDYFGASYGTKLGATYADEFPHKVGRMVLDGAMDVNASSRDLTFGQAGGFETALRSYVQNCVDHANDCYLGGSVEEGLTTIKDFLAQVDARPLPTGTDRPLTEGLATIGLILPLYNRDYWVLLDSALGQALQGNGAGLLQLADAYSSRQDGRYVDNSVEANYAINCLDDPSSFGPRKVEAQVGEFEKASPTLGRTFAWMLAGCDGVQARSTIPPRTIHAAGAPPIVVIGTTRDPATPYAWAKALASDLESGVLVSRDGDGHTGFDAGNGCVDRAVDGYLVSGTVPSDGLSC